MNGGAACLRPGLLRCRVREQGKSVEWGWLLSAGKRERKELEKGFGGEEERRGGLERVGRVRNQMEERAWLSQRINVRDREN